MATICFKSARLLDIDRGAQIRAMTVAFSRPLVVTHDMSFAREHGDQVAFVDRGTICRPEPAKPVTNEPQERARQFLKRVLS